MLTFIEQSVRLFPIR